LPLRCTAPIVRLAFCKIITALMKYNTPLIYVQ
jgi:hypothetical protein